MIGDLRPLVLEAVTRFDSPVAPIFTAMHFAEVVQEVFELRQCPTVGFALDVLAQLRYVARLHGSFHRCDLDHPDMMDTHRCDS